MNGRDIWAKGANWIPFDAMPGKLTEERYRYLLESMVSANMNMVRVWGGGQYEKDIFYDLCDELGILVWQDMMFSCSMYPANKEFLDDVRLEVADQVARLKDHPCLALWCGNNENVGALTWYPETRAFRDRYIIDYDRLNEGAVGSVIRALDPDHAWWPSSPSAGPADYSDCWHSDNRGDMHYWSVWHEGKAFEAYYDVTPRFCSEFGYQSFPSSSGIDSYCPENERNLTSPTMEHHQKNPRGNSIIIENFSRYFRFPEGFDAMLYLSQVQQALAIKTAVEYWRSRRPVCMGALYWQLDDCWPVASWSSIEYSGKWKLLHYAAARFFAPQALIAFKKGDRASIFLLNDELGELAGSLSLRALGFDGKEIWKKNIEARARGEAATEVWSASLEEMGFNPEKAFLVGEFTPNRAGKSQEGRNQRGTEPFKTELFLCEPKRCELLAPELHFELGNDEQGLFVDVEATAPAFYVSLDAGDLPLRWEDNLITLLSNEKRRIRCIPDTGAKKLTAGSLKDALKVYTLRDSYK
ncbi:hypothetical protein MASR2M78_08640 [Treponema sp.]